MKRTILYSLLFLFSFKSEAHYKQSPESYMVFFTKGEMYKKSLAYKKQKNVGQHIFFIKDLYHKNKILIMGVFSERSDSILLTQNLTKEETEKLFAQSPLVKSKILAFKVKKIDVTMIKKVHQH